MSIIGLLLIIFIVWSIKTPVPNETVDLTADEVATSSFAQLTEVKGEVQLKKDGEWTDANRNDFFEPGVEVKTGADSRAVLNFPDGSIVRLAEKTWLFFEQFNQSDIKIKLIEGRAFHRVNEASPAIYQVYSKRVELTALGTAFDTQIDGTLKLAVTEGKVKAKIFETESQENIVNMRTIDEGYVANIDPDAETDLSIDSTEKQVDYFWDDDWIVWNKEQDEKMNMYLGVFAANIKLVITSPEKTEFETDEQELIISGKTDSEAEVFIDGTEVKNNDGSFEHKYVLQEGENKIEINVKKDKKINKKLLTVKYTKAADPIAISAKIEDTNKVVVNFTLGENSEYSTIKLLRSDDGDPNLNNSDVKTLDKDNPYTSSPLDDGVYYFKACLFSDNQCQEWSNIEKVEIKKQSESTITLLGSTNNKNITVNWTLAASDNFEFDDYRIILSEQANPTWPASRYHAVNKVVTTDEWPNLEAGIYYIRVCAYFNGDCKPYSNVLNYTIGSDDPVAETPTGSISLTGTAETARARLSWSAANLTADNGYRILMSFTPTPQYPQDLAFETTDTSYTWSELNTGDDYYFRICAKKSDNTCGTYSNIINLLIK